MSFRFFDFSFFVFFSLCFLCKFLTNARVNTRSQSASVSVSQSTGKSIKVLHGNNLCRVITGLLAMVATTFRFLFPEGATWETVFPDTQRFFFFSFLFFLCLSQRMYITSECLGENKRIIGSSSGRQERNRSESKKT